MIRLKKKEGESVNAFIYRFGKRVKRSGILKEVRKRRFQERPENKTKRRLGALYRAKKEKELKQQRKYGHDVRRRGTR